jgi:hypothetical protein
MSNLLVKHSRTFSPAKIAFRSACFSASENADFSDRPRERVRPVLKNVPVISELAGSLYRALFSADLAISSPLSGLLRRVFTVTLTRR